MANCKICINGYKCDTCKKPINYNFIRYLKIRKCNVCAY